MTNKPTEVGIMGALGHVVAPVLRAFTDAHPGVELVLREAHFADPFGPLRAGTVDIQLLWLPVREPDITVGPTVLVEPVRLAVPEAANRSRARRFRSRTSATTSCAISAPAHPATGPTS
ncbi:LysR substrate-binding domain-containing protein [Nocardia sp. No.11]|uniref:LysR substrate-binding domain-containing protein n=1 Tax=Nocardia sp. No.11 TaxID=3128861 RepID=UPI00319E5862